MLEDKGALLRPSPAWLWVALTLLLLLLPQMDVRAVQLPCVSCGLQVPVAAAAGRKTTRLGVPLLLLLVVVIAPLLLTFVLHLTLGASYG